MIEVRQNPPVQYQSGCTVYYKLGNKLFSSFVELINMHVRLNSENVGYNKSVYSMTEIYLFAFKINSSC